MSATPDDITEALRASFDSLRVEGHGDYPVRQKSARGIPVEHSKFMRTCRNCQASFARLAPGITGARGLWIADWTWVCSVECAEEAKPVMSAHDDIAAKKSEKPREELERQLHTTRPTPRLRAIAEGAEQ